MNILVCVDRDGTLIFDDKYYLGRTNSWKKKIKLLPTTVSGLKLLKKIPNQTTYMFTNQKGIARKDFKLLTLERANKVCEEVINRFKAKGATIDDYGVCPHAEPSYANQKGISKFHKGLVCNCRCIKPKLGMIMDALAKKGLTYKNTKIYVIGDRASDVETAINASGIGIYIPFKGEPEQDKIQALKKKFPKQVYIAKNFLDAAKYITRREK